LLIKQNRQLYAAALEIVVDGQQLFGVLVLLHLLDLAALLFDFLLLLLNLALRLGVGILVVLHLIADYEAGACSEATTDRRPRQRMAHSGADNRTGTRAQHASDSCAFLTRAQRLAVGACSEQKRRP
jgi:hypothetical protein